MLVVERLGAAAERGVSARPVGALDFAKRLKWCFCSSTVNFSRKGPSATVSTISTCLHLVRVVPVTVVGGPSRLSYQLYLQLAED